MGRAKILFPRNAKAPTGPGPSHYRGFTKVSDQREAETPTWQQKTLTKDRLWRHRRDSNLQLQKAKGSRPTPWTARPLGSKIYKYSL